MSPITFDPHGITVAQWVESLPPMECRQLIFLAVVHHPVRFTNAQEIADRWYNTVSTKGFSALCKHARKWLSQEHSKLYEAMSA